MVTIVVEVGVVSVEISSDDDLTFDVIETLMRMAGAKAAELEAALPEGPVQS